MVRILPAALAALMLAFAVACSDDDEDATPTATASQTPGPTATSAVPTETPSSPRLISPGPVEPIVYAPYDAPGGPALEELVLQDVEPGAVVPRESPAYFDVWLELHPVPWGTGESESVVLYNPASRTWSRLAVFGRADARVASDDGRFAAIVFGGRLHLFSFMQGTQIQMGNDLAPVSFSPDGSLLLVQTLITVSTRPGEGSRHILIPTDSPQSAFELPPGALASSSVGRYWPRWLNNDRLLLLASSPLGFRVQVFDVSGPSPATILDVPIASQMVATSPDGTMLAVESGAAVEVFRLDPFQLIATIEGATLGQSADVPSGVWSSDNSRLLVSYDVCGEDERLVAHDIAAGEGMELARGGVMRWAFSPDDVWVAYTAMPDEAYVVRADGSSLPVSVTTGVQATFSPRWSDDSRFAVFNQTVGGYDRCIP